MNKKPKVSIVSISYNQERYIQQALDGFLMQKTNFDFEVIIADDASSDDTQRIIKKVAKENSGIIKPILREKNVGVQNNLYDALNKAQGEYIALCEGDDYWTEPDKLQKQVDMLDSDDELALCFHPVRVIFENGEEEDSIHPTTLNTTQFSTKKLLKENFIQTNSVMYRRRSYDSLPTNILPVDWYLHLYHAQFGKIGFINDVMSVYRRHPGGVWWDSDDNQDKFWKKFGTHKVATSIEILKMYGKNDDYKQIIYYSLGHMLSDILNTEQKTGEKLITKIKEKYPEYFETFLASIKVYSDENNLRKLKEKVKPLEAELKIKARELEVKNTELEHINQSRVWQARNSILKFLNKE